MSHAVCYSCAVTRVEDRCRREVVIEWTSCAWRVQISSSIKWCPFQRRTVLCLDFFMQSPCVICVALLVLMFVRRRFLHHCCVPTCEPLVTRCVSPAAVAAAVLHWTLWNSCSMICFYNRSDRRRSHVVVPISMRAASCSMVFRVVLLSLSVGKNHYYQSSYAYNASEHTVKFVCVAE